jgi:DNA-binding MurR/RpiR family transcriptional regulator
MANLLPRESNLPQTKETVESKILDALHRLSRKQKVIAQFVLDNKENVAFASTIDLATSTRSSPATVVRFCQTLGYEGYPHFQLAVREDVLPRRPAVQRFEERLAHPIPKDSILASVFGTDIQNIELTSALVSREDVQAAVAAIRRARHILVVGGGLAGALAQFLAHSLQVIGRPAECVVGGGESLALAMAFLGPEDVVLGIGFWRNLSDIVRAIEQAREVGATTIGITDSKLSPLALLPDYPLLVASDGVAHSLSPVAAMSLLNALVASLSYDMAEEAAEALHLVDQAYTRANLLTE